MANYTGLLNQMSPDTMTKKPAAGLFDQFGIYSPSEKLRQQMEQNQAMQAQALLQQQIAAQAQSAQLASANAKSQVPTGYNFSQFLALGGGQNLAKADQLANKLGQTQAPQMMGQPDTSGGGVDPGQIVSQALLQYPESRAKALKVAGTQISALGQARSNYDLMNIGATLAMKSQEAEKEEAQIASEKANTAKTGIETNKAISPGDWQNVHDANGDISQMRKKYDAQGKYIGDEYRKGGPNKQIQASDGLTNTQIGANVDKFNEMLTNSEQSAGTMKRIDALLEQGAGQGWVAKGGNFMSNIIGTLKQATGTAIMDNSAAQALSDKGTQFQKWYEKTGIATANWQDLVSTLAKTYNPTGTITEKDINRAAEAVGAGMSNVGAVRAVLHEGQNRMFREVNNRYNNSVDDVKKYISPTYTGWKQRLKPPVFVNSIEEAKGLPSGTEFVTPDGEERTKH